jgi:hypothetical protein
LKPAWANTLRPYLKKTLHKNRAGGVAEGEGPTIKGAQRGYNQMGQETRYLEVLPITIALPKKKKKKKKSRKGCQILVHI